MSADVFVIAGLFVLLGFLIDQRCSDLACRIDRLADAVGELTRRETTMNQAIADALAELTTTVSADTDVTSSAVTTLNALTAKIDELLASSTDPAEVVAAIQSANAAFKANTDALAAGVAANTPGA